VPGSYLPRARITVDRARRSRSSTVIILGPNALVGTPLIDFCMGGYLVRDPGLIDRSANVRYSARWWPRTFNGARRTEHLPDSRDCGLRQ